MKNKGFTLVELLAVIILIGIISLIIVPNINSSIENSKKKTAINSSLAYIKSIKDYYSTNILEEDFEIIDGYNRIDVLNKYVDVSNDLPTDGYILFSDGKVTKAEFCISNYRILYENSEPEAYKVSECNFDSLFENKE